MRRNLVTAGICLSILIGSAGAIRAEVSVRTDPQGNYSSTQVLTTGARGEAVVWGLRHRSSRNFHVLNPRGDANGDLWPLIAEPEIAPHHPWVVWSRFNGNDFDLVWSRWKKDGWTQVEGVDLEPVAGNDLDPDMTFNGEGRPYLVWTREVDGVSTVFFSAFLVHRWMPAFPISRPHVDSRYPEIVGGKGDSIYVEYETPKGTVTRWVSFSRPVTITDDINPLNHVYVKGIPNCVAD